MAPLILAALLACAPTWGGAATPSNPEPPVPAITPADLRVAEADRPLFEQLHALAVGRGAGWRALPFQRIGNFVEARWCSPGVRPAACEGGSVVNDLEPGTAWSQLATLHYDSSWPATFGVVWNAGEVPAEGTGVALFYAQNGAGVVGGGFGAQVLRVAGGRVVEKASLGQYELVVGATTLSVDAEPRAEAQALLAVDSYRSTVATRMAQLREKLATASLKVWHEEPYRGGGIPPERTEAEPTAEERAALLAEGTAELARREALLLGSAEAAVATLRRLVPPTAFGP